MSIMISLDIFTAADICQEIAKREKTRRKQMGLSQAQLAIKSDVSLGSLRRFEQTGEISLHALARIANALDCGSDFDSLFAQRAYRSIREVIDAQH